MAFQHWWFYLFFATVSSQPSFERRVPEKNHQPVVDDEAHIFSKYGDLICQWDWCQVTTKIQTDALMRKNHDELLASLRFYHKLNYPSPSNPPTPQKNNNQQFSGFVRWCSPHWKFLGLGQIFLPRRHYSTISTQGTSSNRSSNTFPCCSAVSWGPHSQDSKANFRWLPWCAAPDTNHTNGPKHQSYAIENGRVPPVITKYDPAKVDSKLQMIMN